MSIHRLSVQLANQIAAGEVVERQCSVVKELVENAVDAGATEIRCTLEGAGRVLIRVSDNGSGIPAPELALALAPHATSKISTTEDLNAIMTLGFRGEALASIASVTRLTLTSRTQDESDGYQVSCEGPEMNPIVVPSPHAVGTTVEARELFFNTPARRRFLRSDRTELNRIRDVVTRAALAHPGIAFELSCDGRRLLKVASATDHRSRLRRIGVLAGSEFAADEGQRLDFQDPRLSIDGVVLPPGDNSQGGAEKCYLFLNGRPIADKTVMHAVREAYLGFGGGAAARCVLFLHCDPSSVDVNVHPRKDEVRFHHAGEIHDLITQALTSALNNLVKAPQPQDPKAADRAVQEPHNITGQAVAVTEQPPVRDLPAFPSGAGSFAAAVRPKSQPPLSVPPSRDRSAYERSFMERSYAHNAALHADIAAAPASAPQTDGILAAVSGAGTPEDTQNSGTLRLIDNVLPDVALVSARGGYYLVCLTALRNQLRASSYRREVEADGVKRYRLLMPFAIKLNPQLLKALKAGVQSAARCGFELEISKNQVTLSAVPEALRGADLAGCCLKVFALIASSDELTRGRCPQQLADIIAASGVQKPLASSEIAALCARADYSDLEALLGHGATDLKVAAQARALIGL